MPKLRLVALALVAALAAVSLAASCTGLDVPFCDALVAPADADFWSLVALSLARAALPANCSSAPIAASFGPFLSRRLAGNVGRGSGLGAGCGCGLAGFRDYTSLLL